MALQQHCHFLPSGFIVVPPSQSLLVDGEKGEVSALHQELAVINPRSDPVVCLVDQSPTRGTLHTHTTPPVLLDGVAQVCADGLYHTTLGRG